MLPIEVAKNSFLLQLVQLIWCSYIRLLIVCLVFAGNLISISVLTKPEMRSNFNHLLTGLASFDFVYLLVSLLIFGLPKLSTSYTFSVYPRIMPIG